MVTGLVKGRPEYCMAVLETVCNLEIADVTSTRRNEFIVPFPSHFE